MKTSVNLQDVFLNSVRRDHTTIVIYLMNGFQIKCQVKGFDSYTVVVDCEGKQELVYKHAISTIIPYTPVRFNVEEVDE